MPGNFCRMSVQVLAAIILPSAIFAGPVIEVDTADFNMGTIIEGTATTLKHVFKIRNSGDSALKITFIRKSCGCTSVDFDPVIPPGGSGSITETISTEKATNGEFVMPISITSNATNSPTLKLSVHGIYKFNIVVEPENLQLYSEKNTDTGTLVTLKTDKKGFQVTGVSFLLGENSSGFTWQTSIPLNYSFALADTVKRKQNARESVKPKNDTPEPNRLPVYKLRIKFPATEKESKLGTFIITTNHPGKPEIKVLGNLVVQ